MVVVAFTVTVANDAMVVLVNSTTITGSRGAFTT